MKKTIYSLIFALGLFGANAFGQVDLTIKEIKFFPITVSTGVKGYGLMPVLQNNPGTQAVGAQTVSIRSLDAANKPMISCDLPVSAISNAWKTFNVSSCLVGSETMKKISKIYVTADADKQIVEINENNNMFEYAVPSSNLPVSGAVLPGNSMTGGGWEFLPDLKIQSWEFSPDFKKIHVTVQSLCGNANYFFVAVDFHEGNSEQSPKVFSFGQIINFLALGSTAKITLDVAGFTQGKNVGGVNFITVTADSNKLQKESNEDNNFLNMGLGRRLIAPNSFDLNCQKR